MLQRIEVEGFAAFIQTVESLKDSGKNIFTMFSGSKDISTGKSWCPDCVVAEPVVEKALHKLAKEDIIFIYVNVGPRQYWKDPNNEFRKDSRTQLTSVPTLIRYGTPERLVESQCANANLVDMILEV